MSLIKNEEKCVDLEEISNSIQKKNPIQQKNPDLMSKISQNLAPAFLFLENGEFFEGFSPAWQKGTFYGEVVFTTGMTGYTESLTDPSYKGQILSFTFPLIGNYGVPSKLSWESDKIHASGVVLSEACQQWSHHSGAQSLLEWLKKENVPLIAGVDTRALTKSLRSHGTMLGAICSEKQTHYTYLDPNKHHLVSYVSKLEVENIGSGEKQVIVIDCGMKANILRSLAQFPIGIRRVPYNYDFTNEQFDGVFISNGPGDPIKCSETIAILRKVLCFKKPIFGICLGAQLLALASGAKTYKLPFGHRGQNQPCIELKTKKCYITSQNHGYAIDETTLSNDWEVTFRSLNDDSVEGISHKHLPFSAVQFHPEASPGPTDTSWLFKTFYHSLYEK